MRVRNATEVDLEKLLVLNAFIQQQPASALPRLFQPPAENQRTKEAFRGFVTDSNGLVLLAEEIEPAGYLYAQFQRRPANWVLLELQLLYIHHLVVAPQYRRRGVGALLLSAAVKHSRNRRGRAGGTGCLVVQLRGEAFLREARVQSVQ